MARFHKVLILFKEEPAAEYISSNFDAVGVIEARDYISETGSTGMLQKLDTQTGVIKRFSTTSITLIALEASNASLSNRTSLPTICGSGVAM
jgi:hypothetical protein